MFRSMEKRQNQPRKGSGVFFFPTNKEPNNILDMTHFIMHNYYVLELSGFPFSWISRFSDFQIPGFPDARLMHESVVTEHHTYNATKNGYQHRLPMDPLPKATYMCLSFFGSSNSSSK